MSVDISLVDDYCAVYPRLFNSSSKHHLTRKKNTDRALMFFSLILISYADM